MLNHLVLDQKPTPSTSLESFLERGVQLEVRTLKYSELWFSGLSGSDVEDESDESDSDDDSEMMIDCNRSKRDDFSAEKPDKKLGYLHYEANDDNPEAVKTICNSIPSHPYGLGEVKIEPDLRMRIQRMGIPEDNGSEQTSTNGTEACLVNINTGLQAPEPVFIQGPVLQYPTFFGSMFWMQCERSTISCQDKLLVGFNVKGFNIICYSGTTFYIPELERMVDARSLYCEEETRNPFITAEVQTTTIPCGNGEGLFQYIGFTTAEGTFIPYIQSCYNINMESAIYTTHSIRGIAMEYAIPEGRRPSFKTPGTGIHFKRGSYTQKQQNTYLQRGHLTPHADGIFRSWRWATYFYINVVPMWQGINNGNWAKVEDEVRKMADRLREDVLIFTGAHHVLELPLVNVGQMPIFLEYVGVPVPKWLWKIIKSPRTDSGIAFITYNNPFPPQDNMPIMDPLCLDVCHLYGWLRDSFSDNTKGYTYCCIIRQLMDAIPTIPAEADASRVLGYLA
ncbi:uncharacterized protein LOC128739556 [Sabethes cyaneus]|uniref:uncharacterized protein LOC128739556 n=1 Tax=Sabethes cyaneus TaxID=53552 RepID=UPI00237E9240|nr:uncharacterized protein LOC128739556 [Sabethes cyaneus]